MRICLFVSCGAPLDPLTVGEVRANIWAGDEEASKVMDVVRKLMMKYVEGFGRSAEISASYYEAPAFFVGKSTSQVMLTENDILRFFEGILARIRPIGYSHTTVEFCSIRRLNETTCLCAMRGTRRRVDGSEMEAIGTTYLLTRSSSWRIRQLIATDLDKLL